MLPLPLGRPFRRTKRPPARSHAPPDSPQRGGAALLPGSGLRARGFGGRRLRAPRCAWGRGAGRMRAATRRASAPPLPRGPLLRMLSSATAPGRAPLRTPSPRRSRQVAHASSLGYASPPPLPPTRPSAPPAPPRRGVRMRRLPPALNKAEALPPAPSRRACA